MNVSRPRVGDSLSSANCPLWLRRIWKIGAVRGPWPVLSYSWELSRDSSTHVKLLGFSLPPSVFCHWAFGFSLWFPEPPLSFPWQDGKVAESLVATWGLVSASNSLHGWVTFTPYQASASKLLHLEYGNNNSLCLLGLCDIATIIIINTCGCFLVGFLNIF